MPIIKLVDLFCQHKTLSEVLLTAVKKGIPELLPNVSFQALNCYPYIPLQKTTLPEKKIPRLKVIDSTVKRDDVIQTLGWPGSDSKEYGYRLNPFTLVLKKKGELKHCQVSSVNKKKFHKVLD